MTILDTGKIPGRRLSLCFRPPLVTTYDLAQVEQDCQDLITGKRGLFKAVLLMDGA
jgi:hypothetical protein